LRLTKEWLAVFAGFPALQNRGNTEITEVDGISAVAVAVSGTGFKVGDAVKTVTQ
jgi:hypothetical protein